MNEEEFEGIGDKLVLGNMTVFSLKRIRKPNEILI
jgi:hypothetical protein